MKTMQLVPAMEQGGVERGVVEMNRVIVGAGWENVVVSAGGRLAADVVRDGGLIEAAHADAEAILAEDPTLESEQYRALAREARVVYRATEEVVGG